MSFLNGRMNRVTYWIAFVVLLAVLTLTARFMHSRPRLDEVLLMWLAIPRLHDIGRSGWWVLSGVGFVVAGIVLGFAMFKVEGALSGVALAVLLDLALMVWLGCIRGQPQTNRFGDPPAPFRFGRKPQAP